MRPLTIIALLCQFAAAPANAEVPREVVDNLPSIALNLGEKVPDRLNDEKLWQAWIEQKIAQRGGKLPPEFKDVAKAFKTAGEELGVFWPGALVQSALETGFYQFGGDVPADNHGFNVAGVGITKEEGKREIQDFETLDRGVRAFLQHLLVYAGEDVATPISNRTRKEKQNILAKARKRLESPAGQRPIRFIDLGSYIALPKSGTESEKFKALAINYGGSVDGFRRQWAAYQESGIGGGFLQYAGDPLYAWKWFRLWQDAMRFIDSPRIEFNVTVHAAWKRGPVSCSIQAKPPADAPRTSKGQPYWNDPYLVVVQVGSHRGYYYPKNTKAYAPDGRKYYEDLVFASGDVGELFQLVQGGQDQDLPAELTVTAVFAGGITATQSFPLTFKGVEREGDQRAREKLADIRRQYAERLKDPKRQTEALVFANHILTLTTDADEARAVYAEALQLLANQPKAADATRRGALMHAHRRGAILRRDVALYMQLLDEIEAIGSLQDLNKVRVDPGHYLMGLVLAVQADNNVELAQQLWQRFKALARQMPAEHPRTRLYQTFQDQELTLPAKRIGFP